MPFPKTNEEFLKLLKSNRVEYPENWTRENEPFDSGLVAQYLFLDALWHLMENPNRPSYTTQSVRFHRKRVEDSPHLELDPVVLKTEQLLGVGVDPKLISEIVLAAQHELLDKLLYMLDDNIFGADHRASDELCYGLFEADPDDDLGKVPKGRCWSLDGMLSAARPGANAPHPSEGLYD